MENIKQPVLDVMSGIWQKSRSIFSLDDLWNFAKKLDAPFNNWALEEISRRGKNQPGERR